ncbi:MAG TPA: hypothetical protein DDW50_06620 [Firmicutes bacterium]|jgi:lactate racemase|nr:hypothetical protein [Bacillota bacterium]
MVTFPWNSGHITISLPALANVTRLEPAYPEPITPAELHHFIKDDLNPLRFELKNAQQIICIIEDPSRISKTADIVASICQTIQEYRGSLFGFEIVVAAGAHFQIQAEDLLKKVGSYPSPFSLSIHDCNDTQNIAFIGNSPDGIPLLFNKKIVNADLRLTISTMNIHPLAGLSGGAKIFLPGVAGLKTIEAFHSLPVGTPGMENSPMRKLINQVLDIFPVRHSWHLLSNPKGEIFKIVSGKINDGFHKAGIELLKIVTIAKPRLPADLLFLGCRPFHQNLIGTFKSLHQIPKLLKPGGSAVLFNEAPQGIGFHHWRTEPTVVLEQKTKYQQLLKDYQVALFSPGSSLEQFRTLFPDTFNFLKTESELRGILDGQNSTTQSQTIVIPYAPITLVEEPKCSS